MTKSEKRYFKLYAGRSKSTGNNLIKLYEVIDKEEVYDENKIIKQYEVRKKNSYYRSEKKDLFCLLLDSMVAYNQHKNIDIQLRNELNYVDILIEKKLLKQGKAILLNLKQKIEVYDRDRLLPEINRSERKIFRKDAFKNVTISTLEEIILDENKYFKQQIIENNYRLLSQCLYLATTNQKFNYEIERLVSSKLFKNETLLKEFKEKINYYTAKSAYYYYKNEFTLLAANEIKLINICKSNKIWLKNNTYSYLNILNNLITAKLYTHDFEDVEYYINELKKIPQNYGEKNIDLKTDVTIISFDLETLYYQSIGLFDIAIVKAQQLNEMYNKYPQFIPSFALVGIYANFAYIHFGLENYTEANKWINKLLNNKMFYNLHQIYIFIKYLKIIIQLELNNLTVVESEVKSIYRYLKKENKFTLFNKQLIHFIRDASETHYSDNKRHETIKETLDSNNFDKDNNFNYEILTINYLASKIENRPFAEVVRERAIKN